MKRHALPTALLSLVIATVPAGEAPAQIDTKQGASTSPLDNAVRAAREFVEGLRKEQKIPGLSVAVARHGKLVFAEGFGFADLEQGVRVTAKTKFRIASLSKIVTAAALGRLLERGSISLDDRVTQHVSYWPKKRWPITIRQLAAHTSGIRHYRATDPLLFPRNYPSVRAGVKIFSADALLFEPGTDYSYSSYAYNLLSATMEGAAKQSFLKILKNEVLTPLGMADTTADKRFEIIPHRTRFYQPSGKVVRNADYVDNSYKWAGGGLLSTPTDLVKLGLAHCAPGYLEKATMRMLFAAQPSAKKANYHVGIGWRVSRQRGRLRYHHSGAITGGRGHLLVYPEDKTCVVLLANLKARFGIAATSRLAAIFDKI